MKSFEGEDFVRYEGALPGPSIFVLGGVHGNERVGILVVRQLVQELAEGKREVVAGTLTIGLGNPAAVEKNVRAIEGRNLNRYFSSSVLGTDDGSYEYQRAQLIAGYIREADIFIDIHSTNEPSVPFVASKNDDAHRDVFCWFTPDRVLVDPTYMFGGGEAVATEEYANTQGKVGICFETGWAVDESVAPRVFSSLMQYLCYKGIFAGDKPAVPEAGADIYQLAQVFYRGQHPFVFAPGRGLRSFEAISARDVVGTEGDMEVQVSDDGVLIFPIHPDQQENGKPVWYFAKKV